MTRTAAEIRNDFLEFFRQREHAVVPGSPVVPYDDPTLLFTNAGMNQFKDVFLGTGTRPYRRAADTQPCIRAGGKHNDLDDVGQDTYHHTFFEMLGNWSFGDYFKKEAIAWAWELLTEVWGLDKSRLHATYFEGDEKEGLEPDSEARELWASVTDIDPSHIHPGNKKDNFWEMGDTGPCGPCSEVHIDLTPDRSGSSLVNAGDARVIEIWNLVFIQFNRDASGKLTSLPAKHVDTGMGFERVTALLQGKTSNYDTDVFAPIFAAIQQVTGAPPYRGLMPDQIPPDQSPRDQSRDREGADVAARASRGREGEVPAEPSDRTQLMIDVSYRVIADHIRCLTFALNDGAVPDREGRGYVLRRILRRAARYGWQYMNMHEPFLHKLVPAVVDSLGDAFPQLRGSAGVPPASGVGIGGGVGSADSGRRLAGRSDATGHPAVGPQRVAEIIRDEEESFDRTLDRGITLFEEAAEAASKRHHNEIRGEDAFKLHDTYGFPIDLTEIMAQEKGLRVDIGEYERLMEEARERSREKIAEYDWVEGLSEAATGLAGKTNFVGYNKLEVKAYVEPGGVISETGAVSLDGLGPGQRGWVVLDKSPFYAEMGGQVGDTGVIRAEDDSWEFHVQGTHSHWGAHIHRGVCVRGRVRPSVFGGPVGSKPPEAPFPHARASVLVCCYASVDRRTRRSTMNNHTATHVMNWALREVLDPEGKHLQQRGSLVDPEKTRFDFSHPKALTPAEIERVEQLVNDRIEQKLTVYDEEVAQADALSIHGMRAVFGEKYPDPVRVLSVGTPIAELIKNPDNPEWRNISIELCGGTHVSNTGQIERFAIVAEEAVAKGIRRIVGITGDAAQAAIERGAELLKLAERLRLGDRPEADTTGRVGTAHQDQPEAGPTKGPTEGPTKDLAAQVAELQQAATEATLRVVDRMKLREALSELQKLVKEQQKQQAAEAKDEIADRIAELLADAPKIGETTLFVAELPDLPIDQLKAGADIVKQKCKSAAVLIAVWADRPSEPEAQARVQSEPEAQARVPGKVLLLAAMSNDLVKKGIKAGDLIKHVAPLVDGRGGGPPTMAQGGGKSPEKIPAALDAAREWIEEKLG